MKKNYFMAILGLCVLCLTNCNQEDDKELFDSLDVSSHTSLTRSSAVDYESGATQSFGEKKNPYTVPVNQSECMLWAILTIAVDKKIPITMSDGKTIKTIDNEYTAEEAYNYIKSIATGKNFPACDVNGNIIDGHEPYNYSGGAMFPSIAKSIGQQSGILKGGYIHFNSYDELQGYIQQNIQIGTLKPGSYIICSEDGKHATVGKGIDKNGKLKYTDSSHISAKYNESDKVGGWTLIY